MESTKTIKGLDNKTWNTFKSLAAENNLKMSEMFKVIINDWKETSLFWDKILDTKKILSDEEANNLLSVSKKIRKESGFR